MPRPRAPWNLKRRITDIRRWLECRPLNLEELQADIEEDNASAQVIASSLQIHLGIWSWHAGTYAVLTGDPSGWQKILLAMRCDALRAKVYLDRIDQLVAADPDSARRQRLPIGRWHDTSIFRELSSILSAIVLGEVQYADWCGRRLLKSHCKPDYVCDANCWTRLKEIPAFLLLFLNWSGIDPNSLPAKLNLSPPYAELFEGWHDDQRFFKAVEELCRYHESHCTGEEDPYYHPYEVFPAEILALRQIRRKLGLSFPEPLEFTILQTPLADVPVSIPREPNESIQLVIEKCRSLMPLEIPWES